MAAPAGLVDWSLAERVGVRLAARHAPARRSALDRLRHDLGELTPLAERLVSEATNLHPPGAAVIEVVDRPAWVRANVAGMRALLEPVIARWQRTGRSPNALLGAVTGRIAAVEIGTLLGWMSGRVLGQYDLLVGRAATATPDCGDRSTVYLVGPNLFALERRHEFPRREFRLWVALHELTHRAQFEGVPWMRTHFFDLAERALEVADPDPARLVNVLRAAVSDRDEARRRIDEGGLPALLATPEQRVALQSIGGLMALLEGHGDVVMDRAGTGHVASAERFGKVLRARRASGSPPVKLLRRLIGLEAKLAQYELGERFLARIEAVAGPTAVDRCWERPEHLPSLDEIRDPDRWLARVGPLQPEDTVTGRGQ
jgi:coenzyme F420 biosynthesis associated uncharacterized protein